MGRGMGAVLVDTYGVGDSVYNGHDSELTTDVLALAHHQAATEVRARLRTGELLPGLAPVDPVLIGMGHSGGAGITVCLQGQHSTFDMVVSFGMPPAGDFGEYAGGADEVRTMLIPDENGYFDFDTSTSMPVSFGPDTPERIVGCADREQEARPAGAAAAHAAGRDGRPGQARLGAGLPSLR